MRTSVNNSRYYFDITDVLEYARHNTTLSGIQRVSLRIIGYLVEKYGPDRIQLIVYHPTHRVVVTADARFFTSRYTFEREAFCEYFALDKKIDFETYLMRKYGTTARHNFHRARLQLLNTVTRGKTLKKRRVTNINLSSHGLRKVNLTADDTVIVLGATWGFEDYLAFLKAERETNGIRLVQFVHDLIPLITPEHVVDGVPDQFCRWLKFMAGCTDLFLVNSNCTKKDLFWFLHRIGCKDPQVKVVPLAHEFISDDPESLENHRTEAILRDETHYCRKLRVRSHVLNMARLPFVLCVGTIESRKNVWTLVNVWSELLSVLGDKMPRLVFAGKHGWAKEDFDDFMRGTGSLRGYIRVCERPYDFELEYLYKRCLFTVFPSYYEGWGLPVGESLWFGKTAAVSNASSMPEVGMDMVTYFDPHSRQSMRETIKELIVNPAWVEEKVARIAAHKLRTWRQVSEELYQSLDAPGQAQTLKYTLASHG